MAAKGEKTGDDCGECTDWLSIYTYTRREGNGSGIIVRAPRSPCSGVLVALASGPAGDVASTQ